MPEVKASNNRLFSLAESQHGVFTTKQAERSGYARKTHFYQVKSGNWVREYRGIYRLAHYPISDEAEYVIWSLWSRNRNEKVLGVYSHETALSIYDLSDINPSKMTMTVPKGFRRNSAIPSILNLHYGALGANEIEQRQGYRVTKPFRTIFDLCHQGTISRDIIERSIAEGINRGVISETERKKGIASTSLPDWAKSIYAK